MLKYFRPAFLALALLASAAPAFAQLTQLGATAAAGGHLSVIHGLAYSARHDVYLTVYEAPDGIRGRFVNASGATVGETFAIATIPGQAIVYANKPMVAYSHDTADDVFFVMYGTDYNKGADAQPSVWIQRVSFTGSGGARVGNPIQVGDGGWEITNDIVYNPATRQFVAVWERFYSEGPDVMVRFFNADGTPATGIVNVSNANHGQGAAKAAVDWERNRILIAYQGLHPNSPVNPEVLGLWAKIIDGTTGALLTQLITVQNGFTIEPMPVFMPEADGFLVAWTGFNPGRDVQARYVSSVDAALGSTPNPIYTIAGSGRQEGAPMGVYDAASRRILIAVQSSGACAGDTCPFLDGAVLTGDGALVSAAFTGLSTAVPAPTGGSFYPDVAVGEGGQFGLSYSLNYSAIYVERVSLPAASEPGPVFGGGSTTPSTGMTASPSSLSLSVSKEGATLGSVTPSTVSLTFGSGAASATWTATTSTPWLQIAGGSGTGAGSFTVTVINPSDVIGTQTSLSGSIVITATGASNSPITLPVTLTVSTSTTTGGTVSQSGATQAAGGHLSVVHGIAYAPRHDVYLTVYESPNGIRGRFVNTAGTPVGDVFAIATTPGQAIVYANKPSVAYSAGTADDVFFVMYGTDYNKSPDAQPSVWIQRVTYTGTGGARLGDPIQVGDGGWEIPNDIVYNPVTRQFVAVWERNFSEGPDVMTRFFNADGTPATSIINVSGANWSQGAAKAAVDWERNRIMIAYQGLHPSSPVNPEVLGLWAKIVDGATGAVLTPLLTVQSGFTIEALPVFLPEVDGFLVAWTGFNPGRDIQGRYVASVDAALGSMPNPIYTLAGSGRQEGAAMGMYDAISRRVLLAVQSSGACAGDTCPYLDGAVLLANGAVEQSFTGLSTVAPSLTGGSFYPDVAVGENGQMGVSYSLNYAAIYVERVQLSAASTPGPQFGESTPVTTGVFANPSSVSFTVSKAGARISSASRSVALTFSTGTAGAWTATTSTPWLQLGSASGSGDGSFTVTVVNPSNVIGSQTSLSGSITITAATAPNAPLTIPVSLGVTPVTLPLGLPIGQVDTPVQNATGVQGAIAVTGWVVDDAGISNVQIFRNCLPFDGAACQSLLGHSVVFLGNATFIQNARPDIEAILPMYPDADRAGWGLQVLSNQLPHVTNGTATGGQGAITFYAIATDLQGNRKVLGRSSSSAAADYNTPTSVTLSNDSIAEPFGTLDTPTDGQVVSGTLPVFGWVLTPDDDAVAGNVDKVVPTDGSTITLFIDGVARANVSYNLCRGSAGPTVATGVFCNDDIANTFGNTSPQPTGTTRTSNPTRFRNLDAGRGAIGVANLVTTGLSNGLHVISWGVLDSAGRTSGLGSRYFTVSNPATDAAISARTMARVVASELSDMPSGDGVWGRTGFDARLSWLEVPPGTDGRRLVRLPQLGRVELWLGGAVEQAYLVANGQLKPLPAGATIDGALFAWTPGPGQLGAYDLAFLRGGERLEVMVEIAPDRTDTTAPQVRMYLDSVAQGTGNGTVRVDGWALDLNAAIGAGIDAVHVWARPLSGTAGTALTPVFVGEARLGESRPDVARAFGPTYDRAGFSLEGSLPAGLWEVTAYVWNRRTARFEDARSVVVNIR